MPPPTIRPRLAPLLALLVLAAAAATARGADEDERTFKSTETVLEGTLRSQYLALDPFHALDDELRFGEIVYAVERTKRGIKLRPVEKGPAAHTLTTGADVVLRARHGKKARNLRVRMRPRREKDGWEYGVVGARRFEIEGEAVLLVDANADGRFVAGDEDGYVAPGDTHLLPLSRNLIVGRHRIEVRALAPDGTSLRGVVRALKGSEEQLKALDWINRLRAVVGLPPVAVDAELSKPCTAHADYLRANGWTGYSDPHEEEEDAPGYTPEGEAAARRCVIMGAPHRHAIWSYWRTYYHRLPFLHPDLERVGISEGHRWISVIDATKGRRDVDIPGDGWADPILVPADGSRDFAAEFCPQGEAPQPVRHPASRGNPLMVYFTFADPGVTQFRGELVRITDEGDVPVKTLLPKTRFAVNARGLIPERRLARDALYRVTYHFRRDGEDETYTATFRTRK